MNTIILKPYSAEITREEYAEQALKVSNEQYAGTFMEGSVDLDTFRAIWDNKKSMVHMQNGDIKCLK